MTTSQPKYYVYKLIDSSTGIPFYVGKGTGNRMYQHEKDTLYEGYTHARSVHSKIKSLQRKNIAVSYEQIMCESENAAFELEKKLIAELGRKDLGLGPLCNLTDGGEGSTNQNIESIRKRAEWHRGRKRPAVSVQRMSNAQTKRKLDGYVPSEETKHKQREALKNKNIQSEEVRRKRVQGRIKRVQQWSIDGGTLLQTFNSARDAADSIGLTRDGNIKSCCLQLLNHVGGFVWRYENDDTIAPAILRPVHQINKDTNEIIKTWDELRQAASAFDVNNTQIISGIKGRYRTVVGFVWKFADGEPDNIPHSRTVDQFNLDGFLVRRWNSISDIGRELGVNKSGIVRCCTGHLKTSHGFIWRYAE